MAHGAALLFDLIAKDGASPAFLKVAGAADKAAAATARAQKGVAGASAAMARTGGKLTKGLTLPLLALGAVSIAQASKWQKAMTLIQTAGGETAAKTAVLSKGLKKLAVETGTALGDLGTGIYTIAKAGARKWSAVGQLKVMRAAAQGAKAENVDLGVATDALSTVMLDYHLNASKAVSTENQLIRASGLAKTSFGLFTESLSNVVPIAAALGISIPEVSGAIATMTQHGVSAQRATENLRNLLFNLSGQNNVASQAMQQLGIDTVDLTKNLGKRGLTGTLAIVDRALAEHTKRGMVVVDVHKAAALATRSLSTMLGAMNKPLREQARGLLDGRVGITDYTKYAKSLGGQAGASALQFRSLYLNSLGFSNQLKNGKGTITTTTAQYAKLLGGMTGASVAMQIGGKYAADNARNVREVGKAALDAGTDVLGWNKTQDTLAVKMDKAKASLQVMAVEIGTALIPAVSKVVGWVSKAVHWFDSLSGTQKQILGWSALVLAALGPLLSIGARLATVGRGIATFAATAGTRIATLAGASETTAARVGVAMRRVTGAVTGVLAGGIAAQVGGSSTGGWLTSIFLGTAGGFALGGGNPITAAIGGISAAIFKGVGLWGDHKKAAQDAARAEIALVHELTAAIEADNGMLGQNVRLSINKKLYDQGTYKLGQTLTNDSLANGMFDKIDPGEILNAAMGKSNTGFDRFALSFGTKVRGILKVGTQEFAKYYQNDYSKLIADFAKMDPNVKQSDGKEYFTAGQKSLIQVAKDYAKLHDAIGPTTKDAGLATDAWHTQFVALNQGRIVVSDFGRGLAELRGNQVTALNTNGDYIHSLRGSGDAAAHNRQIFTDLARAARSDAVSVAQAALKHGNLAQAVKAGNASLATHRKQLLDAAVAAGFDRTTAAGLLTTLDALGKTDVNPKVHVDDSGARSTIENLRAWFNSLIWTAHVSVDGSSVTAGAGTRTAHVSAMGNIWRAYAGGGIERHEPQIARTRPGAVRVWAEPETGGEAYIPLANDRRRPRARAIAARTVAMLGGVAAFAAGGVTSSTQTPDQIRAQLGAVGQQHSPPFDVNQGGYKRVAAQLAHIRVEIGSAKLSAKARAALTKDLARLTAVATAQLQHLRVKIRTADLKAISRAVGGTADDIRAAFATVITDMRNAGASAGQLARIRQRESAAVTANNRYTEAKSYSSDIRGTLAGSFDPTHFGSVADLISGYQGAAGQNSTFAKQIDSLRQRAGKDTSALGLINTLVSSGDTTSLQALYEDRSAADLTNAGKAYRGYNASLNTASDAATRAKFGGKTADQLHDDLTRQVQTTDKLIQAMSRMTAAIGNSHKHAPAHTSRLIDEALSQLETSLRHGHLT